MKCGLYCLLYWRDTLSVMLEEKHGLRVFDSRVHREVFGSKETEVTGN